ncbi:30S ribosomal protein S4 [Candidatus Nasuia deltocephalinicola]|uniref:30S ribosomal protein S4 n=1 Tax=Candidatus Nasuia deltocephalincola TaxID=1160784 RepID=UPI00216AFF9C|nr:30S ribosomal protein S4 [Candidatus Nasuia deltocephalinicola]
MYRKPNFKFYRREKNHNLFLKNTILNKKFFNKIYKKGNNFNQKSKFFISTHYSNQLKEKRKLKLIYGISDKKYNIYYNKSKNKDGDILNNIINFLELRLDNVVYRMFFGITRYESRQIINHKNIKVNNKILNIPSKILNVGDYISFFNINKFKRKIYFNYCVENNLTPNWIFINKTKYSGYLKRDLNCDDIAKYVDVNKSYIFGNCRNY